MTEINATTRQLLDEATQHDGTPPVSDQALLAVSQGKRTLIDFDGEAVGIVGEGEVDLVVRPTSRGRGIGHKALMQLLDVWRDEAPARVHATASAGKLRAWAHGDNAPADALLSGAGFAPVRTLLRMTLAPELLPSSIAEARSLPAGFHVLPFAADGHDARHTQADDWVRVNAAAFASHPEQGAMTRNDFDALTREPWFAADDLRLAYATSGELAAFAWVKTTRSRADAAAEADTDADLNGTETELYALGVAPAFAGRGLGAAMLGETLRRMAIHDPDRISLYVEGDNADALPLYERAGFEVDQRSTQWLLQA